MRRRRVPIRCLLLVACIGCVQPLQGAPGRIETVDKGRRTAVVDDEARPAWARAVAKLTWRTKRGGLGTGTAVLVAPRLAMTAHHCIQGWSGRGTLRFGYNGVKRTELERRTAEVVVAASAAGDWAILRLDKPVAGIAPLEMAAEPIHKYDKKRMLLAGYSCDATLGRGGLVLTYDDKCKAVKVRTGDGRVLTNAICYHGASGGPAFVKDKKGDRYHWIGIVQGNINAQNPKNFVTYAVYQPAYEAALRRALSGGKIK